MERARLGLGVPSGERPFFARWQNLSPQLLSIAKSDDSDSDPIFPDTEVAELGRQFSFRLHTGTCNAQSTSIAI